MGRWVLLIALVAATSCSRLVVRIPLPEAMQDEATMLFAIVDPDHAEQVTTYDLRAQEPFGIEVPDGARLHVGFLRDSVDTLRLEAGPTVHPGGNVGAPLPDGGRFFENTVEGPDAAAWAPTTDPTGPLADVRRPLPCLEIVWEEAVELPTMVGTVDITALDDKTLLVGTDSGRFFRVSTDGTSTELGQLEIPRSSRRFWRRPDDGSIYVAEASGRLTRMVPNGSGYDVRVLIEASPPTPMLWVLEIAGGIGPSGVELGVLASDGSLWWFVEGDTTWHTSPGPSLGTMIARDRVALAWDAPGHMLMASEASGVFEVIDGVLNPTPFRFESNEISYAMRVVAVGDPGVAPVAAGGVNPLVAFFRIENDTMRVYETIGVGADAHEMVLLDEEKSIYITVAREIGISPTRWLCSHPESVASSEGAADDLTMMSATNGAVVAIQPFAMFSVIRFFSLRAGLRPL